MKIPKYIFFLLNTVFGLSACNMNSETDLNKYENAKELKKDSLRHDSITFNYYKAPNLPDSLYFAGERVPLENKEVKAKLLEEVILHANRHGRVLITMLNFPLWEDVIRNELDRNEMPQDFIYLAIAESDLDVNAISATGAAGIWQIMPETGKEFGLEINDYIDQRRDIEKSTEIASKFLTQAKSKFGTWSLAASSYNRGQNGISNALEKQKVESFYDLYLNPETARYFYRILATKMIYENPENFGFEKKIKNLKSSVSTKFVFLQEGEYNTVDLAKKYKMTFAQLKFINPWLIDVSEYNLKVLNSDSIKLRIL